MPLVEINFDGVIGPSHNYAGLSLGNLASAKNAGKISQPRAAALQGLEKMRANIRLGLVQGAFLPQRRPNMAWLEQLAADPGHADPALLANAMSASSMWTANAATISPAPDTDDGLCHLTPANLVTMPHRSHEWPETLAQLRVAFGNADHFAIHDPVPAPFGDEGAANFMRVAPSHGEPGVEIFVYGKSGGPFPARQHLAASQAVARKHRLDPARTVFTEQSSDAIAAGAFHNDVVAVANETVLFCHEQAFVDPTALYAELRAIMPETVIVEVPADRVSLEEAIRTYLFNAQLVTLPEGGMALILPTESQDSEAVWSWLQEMIATNGPIRKLIPVDVRQSMANGGGPACLRLRVLADPATVDPRFLMDEAKIDRAADIVATTWPETIDADALADAALWNRIAAARTALCEALDLQELL
ncbi:N-succinylarginine dihydrolase [Parasphingopyxis lamellibrachiae]|uniref:N-succinylarginine dihydrolase n=1 Tax=Parasphingopyxis lamellibrachiae TaxID=680125 RepID=A0A3D9FDU5_9SPHN|nr:N-succinylarginine dihydrolase [Parasphingopyxis lamellibrachiae]RED15742.1 succinylarginine dihydrolase [Parasphingopyxis lamellibrachiae]